MNHLPFMIWFCRDLHLVFSDPLPGIFIAPEDNDITKVS